MSPNDPCPNCLPGKTHETPKRCDYLDGHMEGLCSNVAVFQCGTKCYCEQHWQLMRSREIPNTIPLEVARMEIVKRLFRCEEALDAIRYEDDPIVFERHFGKVMAELQSARYELMKKWGIPFSSKLENK